MTEVFQFIEGKDGNVKVNLNFRECQRICWTSDGSSVCFEEKDKRIVLLDVRTKKIETLHEFDVGKVRIKEIQSCFYRTIRLIECQPSVDKVSRPLKLGNPTIVRMIETGKIVDRQRLNIA